MKSSILSQHLAQITEIRLTADENEWQFDPVDNSKEKATYGTW